MSNQGGPPPGYAPPYPQSQPGYPPQGYAPQPAYYPPQQVAQQQQSSTNVVVVQAGGQQASIVGGCPACGGSISEGFTVCGVLLAICFFPIGLICCFLMMEKRCDRCGLRF